MRKALSVDPSMREVMRLINAYVRACGGGRSMQLREKGKGGISLTAIQRTGGWRNPLPESATLDVTYDGTAVLEYRGNFGRKVREAMERYA